MNEQDEFYPHEFEATIEHHHVGTYIYTVVFLDSTLHDRLPLEEHPRLRVSGEVRDIPFEGAWQPVRGRWFLMLSKQLMRDGEFEIGDRVAVRFQIEDQSSVDVPEELLRAIRTKKSYMAAWMKLTPGKQRGFAYRVASAKMRATRSKRVAEVLALLEKM